MVVYCDGIFEMSKEQYELFFSIMPNERKLKTMRYYRTEDRQLSVAAYALLCYCAKAFGYEIANCQFRYNQYDKPHLENAQFEFNISHTTDVVACAIDGSNIGVDVQEKIIDYESVLNRFFAPQEITVVKQAEEPADIFTKLWTLKESYVKCLGTGIGDNISAYDFSALITEKCERLLNYYFFSVDEGMYNLSVCSSKQIESIDKIQLKELYSFIKGGTDNV